MADKFNKKVYLSMSTDPKKGTKIEIKNTNTGSEIITFVKGQDCNGNPVVKIKEDNISDNPNKIKVVQNTAQNSMSRSFRGRNRKAVARRESRNRPGLSQRNRRYFTLPPTSAGPAMPPTKPPKETDLSPTLIKKKKLP